MPSIHKHDDRASLIWVAAIVICVLGGNWWGPLLPIGLVLMIAFITWEMRR